MHFPVVVGLGLAVTAVLILSFTSSPSQLPTIWSADRAANAIVTTIYTLFSFDNTYSKVIPTAHSSTRFRRQQLAQNITILQQRRLSSIIGDLNSPTNISSWHVLIYRGLSLY